MAAKAEFLLGVDVGGTKVEVAVLKEDGAGDLRIEDKDGAERRFALVDRERVPTERDKGYEHIVGNIAGLIGKLRQKHQLDEKRIASAGFGLPGSIDPETKKMSNGNTLVLVGRDLAADVKRALAWKIPFHSENDANCFALAEAICGAGRDYQTETGRSFRRTLVVGVILGTGCGGGIIAGGRMVRGRNGGAGEIGHMVFDPQGPPCYCGRRGCPEQYLSGPGVEALFAVRRYSKVQDVVTAKQIFAKAAEEEPVAMAVVTQYRQILGRFLGSLNSVFNPDFFVLGGGVSRQDMIYEGLEKEILANTYLSSYPVKVYRSRLGDSSGVLGAAFLPFVD